jgi:hypothetical protein
MGGILSAVDNAALPTTDDRGVTKESDSGLTRQSGAHFPITPIGASQKIDRRSLVAPTGKVEDVWSVLPNDEAPEEIFWLPEGDVMAVPAGKAIKVQDDTTWRVCEFPQSGRLRGPLMWGWCKATPPEVLAADHCKASGAETDWLFNAQPAYFGISLPWFMTLWAYDLSLGDGAVAIAAYVGSTALSALGIWFSASLFAKSRRLRNRSVEEIDRRGTWKVTLSAQARSLVGLGREDAPVRVRDMREHVDEEVAQALASYHARRLELSELTDIPANPSVEHAAFMIGEIGRSVMSVPKILADPNLRASYLDLLRKAESDVAKVIERREAQVGASVLGDISALMQQIQPRPA